MLTRHETPQGSWVHRRTFVLATAGAAIGLANFWRFPYLMAENGGLWFLGCYLLFLLLLGFPILYAEMLLGRLARTNPIQGMRHLVTESGGHRVWQWSGILGTVAGVLTLALYSVVSGMTLAYVFKSAFGHFSNASPASVSAEFSMLRTDSNQMLSWEILFLAGVLLVLMRGVNKGIERATRFLLPLFFALFIVLLGYARWRGDEQAALTYLFAQATPHLTWKTVVFAAQHAFFTLGIGMGAMMAFGAYSPGRQGLAAPILWVIGIDFSVSILAGLSIFPLTFAAGLKPTQGFDLMFRTMPLAYGHFPDGQFFAAMFFVLMVFAAWSSAIALGEPFVAYMADRWRMSRFWGCLLLFLVVITVAQSLTFCLGKWSAVRWAGASLLGVYEISVSGLLIPLSTFLFVWYLGRIADEVRLAEKVRDLDPAWFYLIWRSLIRYVAPWFVLFLMLLAIANFAVSTCENHGSSRRMCTWIVQGASPGTIATGDKTDAPEAESMPPAAETQDSENSASSSSKALEEKNGQDH